MDQEEKEKAGKETTEWERKGIGRNSQHGGTGKRQSIAESWIGWDVRTGGWVERGGRGRTGRKEMRDTYEQVRK